MKKKLVCISCAVIMAFAMLIPAAAMADHPSQEREEVSASTTDANGITITIQGEIPGYPEGYKIVIDSTSEIASNVPAGSDVIGSFVCGTAPESWMDGIWQYSYTVNLAGAGMQVYEGQKVTLYVQLANGETKYFTAIVHNGSVTFTSQLAKYFTLVKGWPSGSSDDSSVSPKTADNTWMLIAFGAIAIVSAGAVASVVISRKKSK